MSELRTLNCPTCAAPLSLEGLGDAVEMTCKFCGNRVVIPAELRPYRQPTPIGVPAAPQVIVVGDAYRRPRRQGSCLFRALFVFIVAALVSGVLAFTRSSGFVNQLNNAVKGVVNNTTGAVLSGAEGTGPGQFKSARRIALDPAGNFYVTDIKTFRVQKFGLDGRYISYWTVEQGKAEIGPDALDTDGAGNIYVVEDGVILKYDGATNKLSAKFTGDPGKTQYDGDRFYDIDVQADGTIWAVAMRGFDDQIVKLDGKGKVVTRYSKLITISLDSKVPILGAFISLAVNTKGEIYTLVRDATHPRVLKFSPDGKLVARFGDGGDTPGTFSNPFTIVVDSRDRVYVGDQHAIQMFDSSGTFVRNVYESRALGALDLAYDGKDSLYALGSNAVYRYSIPASSAS